PDGGTVTAEFSLADDQTGAVTTPSARVTSSLPASVVLPTDYFDDGHSYSWTVTAFDGTLRSATAGPCHFTIDHQQPADPVVTDDSTTTTQVRDTVNVTFSQPAGTELPELYVYTVNVESGVLFNPKPGPIPHGGVVAAAPGGAPTVVRVAMPRAGGNVVYVYALDAAGNPSHQAAHFMTARGLDRPDPSGDFTGDGIPDFLSVGTAGHPGLWLHKGTDTHGRVAADGVQVGGSGFFAGGTAADWTDATVSTGDFDLDGFQDVLVLRPARPGFGRTLLVLPGEGIGGPFDPSTAFGISLPAPGGQPGDLAPDQVAMAQTSVFPDLYVIAGDNLYRYPAGWGHSIFGDPVLAGSGWSGKTISAAQGAGKPALYARDDKTGKLVLWTITTTDDPAVPPVLTPQALAAAGFGRSTTQVLAGTDFDADGHPDLWAYTTGRRLNAYRPADTAPLPKPVGGPVRDGTKPRGHS
ncbi:MAG: hypothetical protein QOJ50_380, partial [Cryptosporangiaceae bacterium]|nr:hypothetical protein [Cryptosporangiaceae bacterium]